MIESYYWKLDLLEHSKALKPVRCPPRWSEKLMVNFEKDLIISFFMVRKLFETNKVSQKTRHYSVKVFSYKPTGKRITKLNHTSLDEIYNLEEERESHKDIIFIANQFIHSCTIFAYRKSSQNRNWDGVYVCSDLERNKTIYRVPILEVSKIFQLVGNDDVTKLTMVWDEDLGDFNINTN